MRRLASLLLPIISALSACSTSQVLLPHRTELIALNVPLSEEQLLDVGIEVFDPGVPEGELDKHVQEALLEEGIFVHIRRAEAIHMAVQLRKAMRKSRYWGSVWITPDESMAVDLSITATILQSDGYVARVDVRAIDARGHTWVDKEYSLEVAAGAYDREQHPGLDPYQDLYNSIANDIAAARAGVTGTDVEAIRSVSELRYAQTLSPEAFDGYVTERRGTYHVARLPAYDDPMLGRVERIRQRERLFFELLDLRYEDFALGMDTTYSAWRELAREESLTLRDLTRSARWRKGLGVAALVTSLMVGGADSGAFMDSFAAQGLALTGGALLDMAALDVRDKALHAAELEQLSTSFDAEIAPIVVEIEGAEHRLTGTAEEQYEDMRNLLRRLFIEERGHPSDTRLTSGAAGSRSR